MAESQVAKAVRSIDCRLDGGYGYCFFPEPLIKSERDQVTERVLNSHWVSNMEAYECTDYQEVEGVLFVWKDNIQDLKKQYTIK